jgi:hypothetical protein
LIRTVLSNAQWERIAPELPGKIGDPGRSGDDNRLFVEGVLWVADSGQNTTTVTATLTVNPPPPVLQVTPVTDITASGNQGGPFTLSPPSYTLSASPGA